jgi:uncharacterized membrane protein YcaP (DUF421 family)
MQTELYFIDEIKRWLWGDTSAVFLIEVFFRTVLIYLFLLLIARLLGNRMAGQSTITEMAVMITLGAIVSPAMQLPDRGLLFGVAGLICILSLQRGINLWAFKRGKIETLTQGKTHLLVKDGRLNIGELKHTRMTRQQLYSMLRGEQVYQLGEVERAYLEACGNISIYKMKESQPGLPIFPADDREILRLLKRAPGLQACKYCGNVQQGDHHHTHCEVCHSNDWTAARISK